MSQLSKILRDTDGPGVSFICPGCKEPHRVVTGGAGWQWNGDVDKPTLTPSILVKTGHYTSSYSSASSCWCTYNAKHPNNPARFACGVCHSFVTDGQIQFLDDCTHALKGQTVPLPDWGTPLDD